MLISVNARILQIMHHGAPTKVSTSVISAFTLKHHTSVVALHSLHTALQGLSLGEMLWQFVAAGAELEGLLHVLEQLLVVAEPDSFRLSLKSSPYKRQKFHLPSIKCVQEFGRISDTEVTYVGSCESMGHMKLSYEVQLHEENNL